MEIIKNQQKFKKNQTFIFTMSGQTQIFSGNLATIHYIFLINMFSFCNLVFSILNEEFLIVDLNAEFYVEIFQK